MKQVSILTKLSSLPIPASHRHRLSLAPLCVSFLVELIELVENYQNVGKEEEEENLFHAALRLVRSKAIEQNEYKLHLEIDNEHT